MALEAVHRLISSNPLFVAHFVHVGCRIALKFVQAVNGAEIERFRMIIMAGCGISNADFHFANWVDRQGLLLAFFAL
jgi:hypothetical protein